MSSKLSGVILAGGFGTRLQPVVSHLPKPLVPAAGRPFVTYLLDQLLAAGIEEVVLCTGHLGQLFEEQLGHTWHQLKLAYSREDSALGTGGALRLAQPLISAETACVLNGDSYCDAALSAFFERHSKTNAAASILLTHVPDAGRFGRVLLNAAGQITQFAEKEIAGPGWINAGIYLMQTSLLAQIPQHRSVSLEREIFPLWAEEKIVYGYQAPGARFIDIGTPESLAQADAFFGSKES